MKYLFKKISLSSDHAGFKLKEHIKKTLNKKKIKVLDLGPKNDKSVDYPDFAKKLAKNVISKTMYELDFVSSVNKGNVYGVQFHPEKSQINGLQILKNFYERC